MAGDAYGRSEPSTGAPAEGLEKEGIDRLARARYWKALWDQDLRECYFFASPQRQRQIQSWNQPPQQRLLDAAELNTDLAFELCDDFATEVINTYMPEFTQWCERGAGETVTEDQFKQVADQVSKADKQIFSAMKASNLYSEISKTFDPDLAVGTVGMWIDRPRPGHPIVCTAVPMREFEINLGPFGEIDDRFRVRFTRNSDIAAELGPEIFDKVPGSIHDRIKDKPAGRTELRWGFWRLWDDWSDDVWQHVVYVEKTCIHDAVLKGEGCNPLLIFRWAPNPDWPWGHGPLLKGLPSLRQVDELEYARIEHAELSFRPPLGYPDDSFAAIEQGLEPGMAYPIRVGSESAIKPIYQPPPPEAGNYAYEEKERRLRKMFYVDFPQQSGDTPPTLGQWLDEMARAQRRIGRPGLPFWREGPAQIFTRFKYLMERVGTVQRILTADGRPLPLRPVNPSQRAAEQQEIAMATHGLQLIAQFFPEEFKMWVDGKQTMRNLLDKMRVELVAWRSPDTVNAAVDQMQKLLGGTPPGGIVKGPAPAQPGPSGLPAR